MPPASQLRHCGHTRPPLPSRHRHRRGCVTGWGGAWGHPPPQRVLPQPAPQHGDGRQRTQSPGTGSKEGAPKSVPPAVAVHGRNTDQPYRRRAAPFRSPQYPNIPGLGGGGQCLDGEGQWQGLGHPEIAPPHTPQPPRSGEAAELGQRRRYLTRVEELGGVGRGQGAERPCGASPEPTGWGHKAHGSSIIKEDFIRARRWGDPQASPPPWGPCTAPMEPSPHPVGERTTAGGGAGGCGRHHPPINTN